MTTIRTGLAIVLAALTAAGCSGHGAIQDRIPAQPSISFEINSWGRPIGAWRVADGRLSHSRYEMPAGGRNGPARALVRETSITLEQTAHLDRLLKPVSDHIESGEIPCGSSITDLPYGKVEWASNGQPARAVRFNIGCQSQMAQQAKAALEAADAYVQSLVRDVPERSEPAR